MRPIERPYNTAVFLCSCIELGLSMADLEYLTMGMVYDMMIEKANGREKWPEKATQSDFDNF